MAKQAENEPPEQVRYRNSLARVLSSGIREIVGLGFLIDDLHIVTCAHVVARALHKQDSVPEIASDELVSLDFPFVGGSDHLARVVEWKPFKVDEHCGEIDDIAMLELTEELDSTVHADVIECGWLKDHIFQVYGYPETYGNDGAWAYGKIQDRKANSRYQVQRLAIGGVEVQPGFSGAPVLDTQATGVVGMIIQSASDNTATIVPMDVLATSQFLKANLRQVSREPVSRAIFGSLVPQRNPDFTGRVAALRNLHESLNSGRIGAWKQVIVGLGGVGKTQLATEYVYDYQKDYAVVWWMRAEDAVTLANDYVALADALGGPTIGLSELQMANQDAKTRALQSWLENESKWLLVFDNAQKPSDVVKYLPHQAHGHVLVTSRTQNWNGIAHSEKALGEFNMREAVDFIFKRIGESDNRVAEELANELGCLPLALEQAAMYAKKRHKSVAAYTALFRDRHEALLKQKPPLNYPNAVATTWEISFQQAEVETTSATDLLALCAYLAPDTIPTTLFRGAPHVLLEELPLLADNVKFEDAVAASQNYSLITSTQNSISVHPLVQMIVRDRFSEDEEKKWTERAAQLLHSAFLRNDNGETMRMLHSTLLPHTWHVCEHANRLDLKSEIVAALMNILARALQVQANFGAAQFFDEQALRINKAIYGYNHPNVATNLNNLGVMLAKLGDYARARECHQQALQIDKAAYGNNHPSVATSLNNLGLVFYHVGDYARARECHQQALQIDKAAYGNNHPSVATSLNNLGLVFYHVGDYARAAKYQEEALAIYRACDNRISVATSLDNLGVILKELAEYSRAKKCLEQALATRRQIYAEIHPDVAMSLNNLGAVLENQGEYTRARKYHEEALRIRKEIYGEIHPDVAMSLNNLGRVLEDLGDYRHAKECFEKALEIDKTIYGDSHPSVATSLNNLGLLLLFTGDYYQAKELIESAIAIFKAVYGDRHPELATSLDNLGLVLEKLHGYASAKNYLEEALALRKDIYGNKHPLVAASLSNLAHILTDLGEYRKAKNNLEEALMIRRAIYGNNHPTIAMSLNDLAVVWEKLGEYARAQECRVEASRILSRFTK